MDIDGDGDLDLLVGEKYESVHYYQRQDDGSLKEQPLLIKYEKPDGNQDLSYMSISPSFVDWNGDGALDAIIGIDKYKSGQPFPLRLYINKGSRTNPIFDTFEELKDENNSNMQFNCGRTFVADLNMDGKKDLIVGDKKINVAYYKNIGSNSAPVLEKNSLIPNADFGIASKPEFGQNSGFGFGTPRLYDWNKDGTLDLFMSGYTIGKVLIYLNDAATDIEMPRENISQTNNSFSVSQNVSTLQISYSLKKTSTISLSLVDMQGKVMHTVSDGIKKPGRHLTSINSKSISHGMYIAQLTIGSTQICKKVLFTK